MHFQTSDNLKGLLKSRKNQQKQDIHMEYMESLGRGPYIQLSIRKLIGSSLLFLPPLPKIFVDRELPDVVTLSQSLSLILSGIVHSRSVSPLQPQKLELLKGTIMWHCTPSFLL